MAIGAPLRRRQGSMNGDRRRYRPPRASGADRKSPRRPSPCLFTTDPALFGIVTARLASRWSLQQAKSWLRVTYPGRSDLHLPHKVTCRSLSVEAGGALKTELLAPLRSHSVMCRGKIASNSGKIRGQIREEISGAVSIR